MKTIDFNDFLKLDIRIGKVVEAKEVEGSDKLIRCLVDFGSLNDDPDSSGEDPGKQAGLGEKVIFSGIKEWYKPEDLVGKSFPYVINLEPRKMFGEESQGMLLAAAPIDEDGNRKAVLLAPVEDVEPGTKVI